MSIQEARIVRTVIPSVLFPIIWADRPGYRGAILSTSCFAIFLPFALARQYVGAFLIGAVVLFGKSTEMLSISIREGLSPIYDPAFYAPVICMGLILFGHLLYGEAPFAASSHQSTNPEYSR